MPFVVGDRVELTRNVGAVVQGSCGIVVRVLPDTSVLMSVTHAPGCVPLTIPLHAGPIPQSSLAQCRCP